MGFKGKKGSREGLLEGGFPEGARNALLENTTPPNCVPYKKVRQEKVGGFEVDAALWRQKVRDLEDLQRLG